MIHIYDQNLSKYGPQRLACSSAWEISWRRDWRLGPWRIEATEGSNAKHFMGTSWEYLIRTGISWEYGRNRTGGSG